MSLTPFAHHLQNSKETIMERWLAALRSDAGLVPSAQELPEPQLRNHVPLLLDEIVTAIAGKPAPEIEVEGREHGRHRWGDGYDITEVLRELSVLRETLLDEVEGYSAGTPGLRPEQLRVAWRRLGQVIDRCAQAGIAQYHAEALSVRRRLWVELEAANLQLKMANEQKDRFMAMLAHELRNPLAPILTALQLLEFTEAPDRRVRRAREIIERQVRHQARLIDDLLDVSRIVHGKITLRPEACLLQGAVINAVEACRAAIEAKGQTLQIEMPEDPLPVNADPVRLEQVVSNLLTNAQRYTEAGGQIRVIAAKEGKEAVLRVQDTGIGIRPELLTRIFELFTQGDGREEGSRSGLGIGLALVKNLVHLHGGSVEAQSEGPGQGSEFVVRLPLGPALTAVVSRGAVPGAVPSPPLRVAVVEDNADARAVMAELLELLGYSVLTAADGPAALALAQEERPEAFVIDIGLPGMDGYQLARCLRQLPEGDGLLLIALTGYGSREEKEAAVEAGFDAHLTKPADIDELQRLLATPSPPG